MSEENSGNNAEPKAYDKVSPAIQAQLQSQMAEGQKQVAPITETPSEKPDGVNATATEQVQAEGKTTPSEGNKDSLQQFRGKDGEVDPQKIEKSNEHLKTATLSKEERITKALALNKELMRKFTKVSQESKSIDKEVTPPESVDVNRLSPEFKKKLVEDLEKDPAETLVKMADAITKQHLEKRVGPLEKTLSKREEQELNEGRVKDLDEVFNAGHDWVFTDEGQARFDGVFAQRPWLLNSPTPYSDAVRFLDLPANVQGSGDAQPAKVPILGSFPSAPPPTSTPPVTNEQTLEKLSRDLTQAIRNEGSKSASAALIRQQLEKAYRTLNPDTM